MTPFAEKTRRIVDAWWCDGCEDIHLGSIDSFSMDHRCHLHPVFAHLRPTS